MFRTQVVRWLVIGFAVSMLHQSAMSQAILSASDPIIAFDFDVSFESNYPAAEAPFNLFDGDVNSKYLNFGKENSGFIVTPLIGATTIQSLVFSTANDAPERDPASWELFGTHSANAI